MIHHQSSFDRWPLENGSVQAVITSPPYWSLRCYKIPDITIGGWTGQHGCEETFELYIEHAMIWISEAWRVLKDDGVIFINIADTYYAGSQPGWGGKNKFDGEMATQKKIKGFKRKCKVAIPERLVIAMIEEGWVYRNRIVWHKPNCCPESVSDRFSRRFEPILMLSKNSKYFFNLDAVREPHEQQSLERQDRSKRLELRTGKAMTKKNKYYRASLRDIQPRCNPKGKNPGDIWAWRENHCPILKINNQPRKDAHFAMFPDELPRQLILASTKPGDVVVDPFVGSGTTVNIAEKLSRIAHGIDLGYENIQGDRMKDSQKEMFV